MWGTLLLFSKDSVSSWFIPTHVGNSVAQQTMFIALSVHPHACGELFSGLTPLTRVGGSSPRMWGTHHHHRHRTWIHRFIPTHVGNSTPGIIKWRLVMVHPHACGELNIWEDTRGRQTGSSPRMWGTRLYGPCYLCWWTVHPHACGELLEWPRIPPPPYGSSPRMWGTLKQFFLSLRTGWFIPTHVGNSGP